MGFEKVVLEALDPVIECGDTAKFYNGTLFVELEYPNAIDEVIETLRFNFPYVKVQVSALELNNFAIDFV